MRSRLSWPALLSLLCASFAPVSSRSDLRQAVLSSGEAEGPHASHTTLVDLLSADEDHSELLKLLQRSRLVTTLNRLNGTTFFAPTNDAIRAAAPGSVWSTSLNGPVDNIQAHLRATLLYHLVNYTLPYNTSQAPNTVQTIETLLFPQPEEGTGSPGQPPDRDEDLYPGSLLAGEGQKLRLMQRKGGEVYVGTDGAGKGGALIVKADRNATNGNLVSIGAVLEPPKSVGEIIQSHASLKELARLLPSEVLQNLTSQPHITLFAPVDASWDSLSPLERQYLKSGFAQTDLAEILGDHTRSKPRKPGSIGYLSRLTDDDGGSEIMVDSGSALIVASSAKGAVHVNSSKVIEGDILASNGVVHIIDSLLLPPESLGLTVEKTLIALNATLYVAAMRSANLSSHLQHHPTDGPKQTVLAFQDSAAEQEWIVLPEPGTTALSELLQYHIVEGAWKPADLGNNQLLDTKLQPKSLKGAPQKLQVTRQDDFDKDDRDDIVFGNANVIAGPYEVGNSIVYVLSQVLEPPPQVLEVAMTNLRLSTFAASVYAAESAHLFRHAPATTIFAPTNEAFQTLGLVLSYLLMSSAKPELRQVLTYHAVKGLLYLDGNINSTDSYETIEGSPIEVKRYNGTTELIAPTVAGFPSNGDLQNATVMPSADTLLTDTGVLHVLNQVELPPDVTIDLVKLLRAAKGTTMLELLKLADMSWVLNGEERPENRTVALVGRKARQRKQREQQKKIFGRSSYTVLCPSDKAFSRLNLTYYRSNQDALRELLELHVIRSDPPSKSAIRDPSRFPSRGRPIALTDSATYSTLLSEHSDYGDLAFRAFGRDMFVVGVKGAKGANGGEDYASVVAFGRATPNFVSNDDADVNMLSPKMVFGGGVLALDAVLTPYRPTWWYRYGWVIAVVCLSVCAAGCVGLLFYKLCLEHKAQRAYDRLEGEED